MSGRRKLASRFTAFGFSVAAAVAAFPATPFTSPGLEAGQDAPPDLRVYILDCGYGEVKDVSGFSSGFDKGVPQRFVDPCYLIRHPRGTLIWDTGLPDSLVRMPNGYAPMNGNITFRVRKTLASELATLGIRPADVTYLALSHMDFDHSGNANMFAGSTLLIQEAEHRAAFIDTVLATQWGQYYAKLRSSKTVMLNGAHDVFGDSSVVIYSAPGHTPGHQVLLLRLPKTGPVVLSGDLWHFAKNRRFRRMPVSNFDRAMTLRSMDMVENLLTRIGGTLWIQHEPEHYKTLPHSPAFIR